MAKAESRTAEGALGQLIDLMPEPVLLIEPDTLGILRANAGACDVFGIEANPQNLTLSSLLKDVEPSKLSSDKDTLCQTPGGAVLHVRSLEVDETCSLLRFQTSEFGERALHNQRLQTLGMLAGAVAHDFNNVLAGVLGHVSYLKSVLPKAGQHCESLDAIEDGGKNASQLIQEILAFSRLDISQPSKAIDLCAVVRGTCKLLRGALVPRYNFLYKIPETQLWFNGVEGKLAQVVVNLVVNARNASTPGSTVNLELSESLDVRVQEEGSAETVKGFACLKISDQGRGMPKEVLDRIFEPYFTTSQQGTGLGLKIVDSIIAGFGGSLQIDSEPGKGTVVSVFLPLAEANSPKAVQKQGSQLSLSGKEKILVVDDDDGVRRVMQLSLQHFGYTVELAESAKEALKLFAEASPPFDLVILDMLMPEVSGKDLFLMLREQNPEIRLLLVSGYVSEKVVKGLLKQGNCAFLPKPFTVEELSESIRLLFD